MLTRRLSIASVTLYVAYVAGAVLLAASIFEHLRAVDRTMPEGRLWGGLAAVVLVYLTSHLLRSFRLYVILLDFERSFVRILALYATLTFVNRMFPFKFGEVFRFFEFTHMFNSPRLAVVVIATERFFDAVILIWLLLYGLMLDSSIIGDTTVLLIVLSVVAIFGVLIYRGLPGFARYLRLLAATRSRGTRGLTALRLAAWLEDIWLDVHRLLKGRAVVLALISFAVWTLEIAAMALIVNLFTTQSTSDFPGALLRALNSLLANGVERSVEAIEIYFAVTFMVIGAAGFPLLLFHSFIRFRDFHAAMRAAAKANARYVRADSRQVI